MTHPTSLDERELLDLLLAEAGIEPLPAPEARPASATAPPLSHAQRRLWFFQQQRPECPAYNISSAVRLTGPLDVGALNGSLHEIMRRHEALRMSFPVHDQDGRPSVQVRAEPGLEIAIDDLSGLGAESRGAELSRLSQEEARRPFDLASAPLLRLRLLRLGELEHVAVLTMHHIVSDGWSMGVLLNELDHLYDAVHAGQPSRLPELPLQYSDFARQQEDWLVGEAAALQRRWWKERLAGWVPLELPTDRPRPAEPSYRGAAHQFRLSGTLLAALHRLGQEEEATLFMTLLAGFSVLLYRYSGQEDIVVGAPVANRNRRELEPLIGLFVNSLVMRCDLSGEPSFRAVLQRVRDFALEALARQDYPFDELVKEHAPERDGASNPLFQVMFSVEQTPVGSWTARELTLTPIAVESLTAKFDLFLNMTELPDGLLGAIEYSTDLFDADTIARLSDHFTTLLEAVASVPEVSVATVPLMTAVERRQLLEVANDTASEYPRDESIHRLFERQVERGPHSIAVDFGAERLTYHELNARANRLACRLRESGVRLETPVAIHLHRSADLIVGLLAILKAGGCYVPLDPAYPRARLEFMRDDCQAPVVLTARDLAGHLASPSARTLCLDDRAAGDQYSEDNLDSPQAGGGHLAYVIYTSGSTGAPKGVTVPHRAVTRLILNSNYITLGPDDRIAQASNASFDAATFEIWGALLNGGQLIGVERDVTLSPPDFAAFLLQRRITTLFLTTALFNQMAREMPGGFRTLRHVLFGGEQVDPHWVREVLRHGPPRRLLHVYGPTENTTFSTWHLARDVPSQATLPIGKAISNTQLYVLDGRQQPVPVGIPGELYLGGDGLAQGYFRRPELTDERFVANPFDGGRSRLYRTGDLVRWLRSGDLEFIGRRDSQVKIRGFRIELEEVEAALVRHNSVRDAAVVVREDRPGHRELVAYVVGQPTAGLNETSLREALGEQLPAFMVPAKYVLLPALPLNQNGKVDRGALPAPRESLLSGHDDGSPRGEPETSLAAVWQDVLGREGVGTHDNYFALGGDSITAIQVVSRLKRRGWRLRVADLFRHPTIAQLAPYLQTNQPAADTPEEFDPEQDVPLTAVQRWFFAHYHGNRSHFHQTVLLKAATPLDSAHLVLALRELLRRHDALRLRFVNDGDSIRQTCLPPGDLVSLEVIELRHLAEPAGALEHHAGEIQRDIDIERGPLLKAALFQCVDGDRLLLVIHHLAVDAVSWRILLEELELAYRQAAVTQVLELGSRTCSFRRWAREVQRVAHGNNLRAELPYWSAVEAAGAARLPLATTDTPNRHGDTQTLYEQLSEQDTADLLTRIPTVDQTEIMDVLLTALNIAVLRWSGAERALVTVERHGRDWPFDEHDLTRTVGWFTSLFPFELATAGADLGQTLHHVKDRLRSIPNKGIGYGLLRYVAEQPVGRDQLSAPQISFNYLGQFDRVVAKAGLFEFSSEPTGPAIDPQLIRAHELDFGAIISGGCLILSLEYHPLRLPTPSATALLADLRLEVQKLIEHCRRVASAEETRDTSPSLEALVGGEIEDVYPLSPMQNGLLFQRLFEPDNEAYLIQTTHRIVGQLRGDIFQQCWTILARRHAVLRTAFVHEGIENPLQVVLRDRPPEFRSRDWRGMALDEQQRRIDQFRREDRSRGFDLQRDVLLRVSLFRLADDLHELVLSYHHMVIDGWCLSVVYRDLVDSYHALCQGQEPHLPPVAPYRRFIDWLAGRDRWEARRYWGLYTAGYDQAATFARWRSGSGGPQMSETQLVLDASVTKGLKRLAAESEVTLSTVLQCLWGLLLCRHNEVHDVVFGSVVSGRPAELDGVENMVGLFINTLPVRIQYQDEQSMTDLLKVVQEASLECQHQGYLPLAEIQGLSPLGRDLFDHLFVCENYPRDFPQRSGRPDEVHWRADTVHVHDHTHYDLTITIEVGETIGCRLTHRSRYPAEQIEQLARQLAAAARNLVDEPRQPLSRLAFMTEAERRQIQIHWNATERDYPPGLALHQLFEEQAARTPDRIAVVLAGARDKCLTYEQLNARANQLARWLKRQGVGPESLVGILADRSLELVVGLVGVLKAGGGYLPLDPEYPRDRLAFMLADSRAAVLITHRSLSDLLPPSRAAVVRLDDDWPAIAREDNTNLAVQVGPDNLAYAIYTSGSTGVPKGVTIPHRAICNHMMWMQEFASFGPDDVVLQKSPCGFDASVWEFYAPLLAGARLVMAMPGGHKDPSYLIHVIREEGVTALQMVPTVLRLLVDEPDFSRCRTLRRIFAGGEVLTSDLARKTAAGGAEVINLYGPTEATIDATYCQWDGDLGMGSVPIGVPIANMQVYILDQYLQPVPVGVAGELYIGGAGLARGYHDRPELTAERFVPDPFSGKAGARLYRSGDRCRWLPDGKIEYLERVDHQVKVRGMRIELAEIETRLAGHPAVREAVVRADRATAGDMRLNAWIVPHAGCRPTEAELRSFLEERLPDAMVPEAFVLLDSLPTNPSGKLNRTELVIPEPAAREAGETVPPRTELERGVAEIWREVLQLGAVGIHDDFFTLGGHSLKAMQIVAQIHRKLSAKVRTRDVFDHPTVSGLASVVATAPRSSPDEITPAPKEEYYDLSHAQRRMWLMHQLGGAAAYNMPEAYVFESDVDVPALTQAFNPKFQG